jgi:hypothetical protein
MCRKDIIYETITHQLVLSEWACDCCLTPREQFSVNILVRQVVLQWDGDDVHFVLDQTYLVVF